MTETEPKKGDFVLIKRETKNRISYKMGTFENIVNDSKGVSYAKFKDLYNLTNFTLFDTVFPDFVKFSTEKFEPENSSSPVYGIYIRSAEIETVAIGLEEISLSLQHHPDSKYRSHAGIVRKIAEAQK